MAFLWIHCYASAAEVAHGAPYQSQRVAVGAVSANSAAIQATPDLLGNPRVRLHSDVALHFHRSLAPTAVATSEPMAADQTEYFDIKAGHLVAVIERQA